ncbi:membrane-spanning protein [Neobacillus sp. LXY-1]|uniref:membrane-spanning protein n=1 Tax=Neobacillus sp. LXY-1 TaxID=3379133 RepID=UPI003EE27BC8
MKQKIILIFSILFMCFMTGLLIYYLIKGDSSRWQISLGGILASGLPLLLLRMKDIPFNIPIIFSYFIFLFCSLFLGSISSFYLHYKWWDSTLHFYKGMYIGFVGIPLFKTMIPTSVRDDVSVWMVALFVLSLAVLASVLWEIYEFVGDLTFTHTMQRGGNKDTMLDLLSGMAGGLLPAFYALLKKKKG